MGFATAAIITGLGAAGPIETIFIGGSSEVLLAMGYSLTLTTGIVLPLTLFVGLAGYGGYKIYKEYKKRNKDCKRDPRVQVCRYKKLSKVGFV